MSTQGPTPNYHRAFELAKADKGKPFVKVFQKHNTHFNASSGSLEFDGDERWYRYEFRLAKGVQNLKDSLALTVYLSDTELTDSGQAIRYLVNGKHLYRIKGKIQDSSLDANLSLRKAHKEAVEFSLTDDKGGEKSSSKYADELSSLLTVSTKRYMHSKDIEGKKGEYVTDSSYLSKVRSLIEQHIINIAEASDTAKDFSGNASIAVYQSKGDTYIKSIIARAQKALTSGVNSTLPKVPKDKIKQMTGRVYIPGKEPPLADIMFDDTINEINIPGALRLEGSVSRKRLGTNWTPKGQEIDVVGLDNKGNPILDIRLIGTMTQARFGRMKLIGDKLIYKNTQAIFDAFRSGVQKYTIKEASWGNIKKEFGRLFTEGDSGTGYDKYVYAVNTKALAEADELEFPEAKAGKNGKLTVPGSKAHDQLANVEALITRINEKGVDPSHRASLINFAQQYILAVFKNNPEKIQTELSSKTYEDKETSEILKQYISVAELNKYLKNFKSSKIDMSKEKGRNEYNYLASKNSLEFLAGLDLDSKTKKGLISYSKKLNSLHKKSVKTPSASLNRKIEFLKLITDVLMENPEIAKEFVKGETQLEDADAFDIKLYQKLKDKMKTAHFYFLSSKTNIIRSYSALMEELK